MSYIGKDIIHYGCGLELDPEKAINSISHAARKNIKKAEEQNLQIRNVAGDANDLLKLRAIWYLPDDPNFPVKLQEQDCMYLAEINGQVVAGMILIAVGQHYFLNNLAANDEGKKSQAQSALLWHAVNDLSAGDFSYIDVGVSYRPNLYRFFKSWATFKYPVIFNPPDNPPKLTFQPVGRWDDVEFAEEEPATIAAFCLDRPYTIVPSKEWAIKILQSKGEEFKEVLLPQENIKALQVVDLPMAVSACYGALIVGLEISEQELWNDHGCFDFVKTDYVKMVLSHLDNSRQQVQEEREKVFDTYRSFFTHDEVELKAADTDFSRLRLSGAYVDKLAAACGAFGVDHEFDGEQLTLPCHQNLSFADIEYIYGIYRGVLNLCSEWAPTHVRGELKSDS